ncbi:UNVERIFIED_CONTAM: hypothetical protein NCL1_58831 [Trichonephila clavipes]
MMVQYCFDYFLTYYVNSLNFKEINISLLSLFDCINCFSQIKCSFF